MQISALFVIGVALVSVSVTVLLVRRVINLRTLEIFGQLQITLSALANARTGRRDEFTGTVTTLSPKPGDVLIVSVSGPFSAMDRAYVTDKLRSILPDGVEFAIINADKLKVEILSSE